MFQANPSKNSCFQYCWIIHCTWFPLKPMLNLSVSPTGTHCRGPDSHQSAIQFNFSLILLVWHQITTYIISRRHISLLSLTPVALCISLSQAAEAVLTESISASVTHSETFITTRRETDAFLLFWGPFSCSGIYHIHIIRQRRRFWSLFKLLTLNNCFSLVHYTNVKWSSYIYI